MHEHGVVLGIVCQIQDRILHSHAHDLSSASDHDRPRKDRDETIHRVKDCGDIDWARV